MKKTTVGLAVMLVMFISGCGSGDDATQRRIAEIGKQIEDVQRQIADAKNYKATTPLPVQELVIRMEAIREEPISQKQQPTVVVVDNSQDQLAYMRDEINGLRQQLESAKNAPAQTPVQTPVPAPAPAPTVTYYTPPVQREVVVQTVAPIVTEYYTAPIVYSYPVQYSGVSSYGGTFIQVGGAWGYGGGGGCRQWNGPNHWQGGPRYYPGSSVSASAYYSGPLPNPGRIHLPRPPNPLNLPNLPNLPRLPNLPNLPRFPKLPGF